MFVFYISDHVRLYVRFDVMKTIYTLKKTIVLSLYVYL